MIIILTTLEVEPVIRQFQKQHYICFASLLLNLCFFLHNVLMVSGGSVSCIATDDSRPRPGAVAVAGDNQLLVFLHSEKSSVL